VIYMPLITYKGNGQYKELAIFADEDLINNKIALSVNQQYFKLRKGCK